MAPCLFIFQILDSLVKDEIRSYFLNDGILMIGSTNHLDKLDPAISMRSSWFDWKHNFKLQHIERARRVWARLRAIGLQADIKKSEFYTARVKYLGFIITTEGIEVDPVKISAVNNWPKIDTQNAVQSFLEFCGVYCRYIKDYGGIVAPLKYLTRDSSFNFTDECRAAVKKFQDILTSAPILRQYGPSLESLEETDALDGVVAGAFSQ